MKLKHGILSAMLMLFSLNAMSAVYEIKMLNKGSNGEIMVFEPDFIKVNVGDTVKLIPTDKAHSAQSFKDGLPKGAKEWKAGLGKEITLKMDVEGVHVFQCLPHYAMGMVGAIQVGKPTNLDTIKSTVKMRGKAQTRLDAILKKVK